MLRYCSRPLVPLPRLGQRLLTGLRVGRRLPGRLDLRVLGKLLCLGAELVVALPAGAGPPQVPGGAGAGSGQPPQLPTNRSPDAAAVLRRPGSSTDPGLTRGSPGGAAGAASGGRRGPGPDWRDPPAATGARGTSCGDSLVPGPQAQRDRGRQRGQRHQRRTAGPRPRQRSQRLRTGAGRVSTGTGTDRLCLLAGYSRPRAALTRHAGSNALNRRLRRHRNRNRLRRLRDLGRGGWADRGRHRFRCSYRQVISRGLRAGQGCGRGCGRRAGLRRGRTRRRPRGHW